MERIEMYADKVYTVDEVAAIFRVPSDTIRRLIHSGDLPAIRLGHVYRVPKSVIDGYFDLPPATVPLEKLGFGMWKEDAIGSDAVEYVNRLREADTRTLREVVEGPELMVGASCLLDTDVLIDWLQGRSWTKEFISSRSVPFVLLGGHTQRTPEQARYQQRRTTERILRLLRVVRVINADSVIAAAASELLVKYPNDPLHVNDALIAATAWVKRLPLLTAQSQALRVHR